MRTPSSALTLATPPTGAPKPRVWPTFIFNQVRRLLVDRRPVGGRSVHTAQRRRASANRRKVGGAVGAGIGLFTASPAPPATRYKLTLWYAVGMPCQHLWSPPALFMYARSGWNTPGAQTWLDRRRLSDPVIPVDWPSAGDLAAPERVANRGRRKRRRGGRRKVY